LPLGLPADGGKRYNAARSYALIGDVPAVRALVDDADRDYAISNSQRDLMADEVGGEFAFGTAWP
jgi:hypothetical protein